MKHATLVFVQKDDQVLLGKKKKGFGAGKWNGFGGKVEQGESIEGAAIRELKEESGLEAEVIKRGELTFRFIDKPEWDQVVHVFLATMWQGSPKESDEMRPKWTRIDRIPFNEMWADDVHWLPQVLRNKEVVGTFLFECEELRDFLIEIKKSSTLNSSKKEKI